MNFPYRKYRSRVIYIFRIACHQLATTLNRPELTFGNVKSPAKSIQRSNLLSEKNFTWTKIVLGRPRGNETRRLYVISIPPLRKKSPYEKTGLIVSRLVWIIPSPINKPLDVYSGHCWGKIGALCDSMVVFYSNVFISLVNIMEIIELYARQAIFCTIVIAVWIEILF